MLRTARRIIRIDPFLMAAWLGVWNRVDRGIRERLILKVALVATVILASIYLLRANQLLLDPILPFLNLHTRWVGILAALHSAFTVARRKRTLTQEARNSWLAATQRAAVTVRYFVLARTFFTACWQLALVIAVVLTITLMAGAQIGTANSLIGVLVSSWAAGGVTGWLFPGRTHKTAPPSSRYIPIRAGQPIRHRATLDGLSRWPIAHAFAWAAPDTVRWPFMAALLSVSAGSSALAGLGVVIFWSLVLYAITLLNSTLKTISEAAHWIKVTPLSFKDFAAAIAGRSFAHQFMTSLLIAALLSAGQMSFHDAALFVSPWISFVILAYSITMASSFGAKKAANIKIASAAIAIGALELVQRGVAVPLSLLIAWWYLRHSEPSHTEKCAT